MRWLITGGCGFIGTTLIKRLIAEGVSSIRVVDNLQTGSRNDLARVCNFKEVIGRDLFESGGCVELIVGDIRDDSLAMLITKDCDVIVHLAANTGVAPSVADPRSDMTANVIGTFNYLEAARANSVPRFIFASSGAPVGEVEPPIHEEVVPHPVSPYGASKLSGEAYCSVYKRTFGVDTVMLRFGNVYGPGSAKKASIVAKFIKGALEGHPLEIYGDGNQTRDFIFIDDLIDAIVLASSAPDVGGEIFQIATNTETTVTEIAYQLKQLMLNKGVGDVSIVYGAIRVGDVRRNYSDTSKARKILGWKPKVTLVDGLKKTVEYFLEQR